MSIEEIKEAKDELERLSNDDEQRMIYEMRSKILKDKISALNKAKNKGIKEGIQKGLSFFSHISIFIFQIGCG
ncbi:MAG: hypothetical protein N4A48_00860 [Tepidibacter sp.]|jgi:predicted transposase/invertase (TIGR01784 family)|uniref:hypothetical protein n=1 Tax=Tepidibacter sp. TaxID=2529387 RepID=UPI002600FFFD|nr:hypothetical protein [Tepidibacter sp.]MCT4507309.1 hypothetical protein [Tepidibacter sp.]